MKLAVGQLGSRLVRQGSDGFCSPQFIPVGASAERGWLLVQKLDWVRAAVGYTG